MLQHEVDKQHEQLLHELIPEEAAVSDKVVVSSSSTISIPSKTSSNTFLSSMPSSLHMCSRVGGVAKVLPSSSSVLISSDIGIIIRSFLFLSIKFIHFAQIYFNKSRLYTTFSYILQFCCGANFNSRICAYLFCVSYRISGFNLKKIKSMSFNFSYESCKQYIF